MAFPTTIYGYCRDGFFRASFLEFLPESTYDGPLTYVLANSKCMVPVNMLFKTRLQVLEPDSNNFW